MYTAHNTCSHEHVYSTRLHPGSVQRSPVIYSLAQDTQEWIYACTAAGNVNVFDVETGAVGTRCIMSSVCCVMYTVLCVFVCQFWNAIEVAWTDS